MKKRVKGILLGILLLFVAVQALRPDRTNPASDPARSFQQQAGAPPVVLSALRRACYDCHSNETTWPWYSNLTPVNFVVAHDVREGRQRLNFSEWGSLKPMKRAAQLEDVYDEVYNREMPPKKYLLLHPDARLTDAEITAISDWCEKEQERLNSAMEDPTPVP